MNPYLRVVAAALLAFLLPVQGVAAACAQICAQVGQAGHAQMMATMGATHDMPGHDMAGHGEAAAGDEHCAGSDMGAGKCCKAHTFLIDTPAVSLPDRVHDHVSDAFVARWTNFIPEEPSPPPIASRLFA